MGASIYCGNPKNNVVRTCYNYSWMGSTPTYREATNLGYEEQGTGLKRHFLLQRLGCRDHCRWGNEKHWDSYSSYSSCQSSLSLSSSSSSSSLSSSSSSSSSKLPRLDCGADFDCSTTTALTGGSQSATLTPYVAGPATTT